MALIVPGQVRAILWAQWRALLNYSFRQGNIALGIVTGFFMLLWYCIFGALGVGIYIVASSPDELDTLRNALPLGFLLVFGYWQIVPVLLVSSGLSLDLKRLIVYPVPHGRLFGIEVALRLSTAPEMILVTLGLVLGVMRNPALAWWAPLPAIVFTAANLFLSAGIRDVFTRWMSRKYFREALVLGIVLISGLPQLFLLSDSSLPEVKMAGRVLNGPVWLWTATADLTTARSILWPALSLVTWTAAAWWFGRRQFERSLQFDAAETKAVIQTDPERVTLLDRILRLPSRLFSDPLAALLEKEIRFLSRAPRFRLLFLMGFSFGLLIWLPLTLRSGSESAMRSNYLTIVSVYALMLLGEICFWNSFGLDRTAAQTYFVMPVRLATVLVAKNLTAVFFIVVELAMVTLFCFLFRMPVTIGAAAEAFAVTAVVGLFMLSAGNMLSTRYARGIDPSQAWRAGSVGRVQLFVLLVYPLASAPVVLAYGARYAFESDLAFYGVLALDLLIGAIVYWIALESAVHSADYGRERMLQALSGTQGPVGG